MIRAIGFDVGHTLIDYKNPLNWSSLYRPALRQVCEKCGLSPLEQDYQAAEQILSSYNTRLYPREQEVTSAQIFGEILAAWKAPESLLPAVREAFYGFFQAGAFPYPDAEPALRQLHEMGVKIGVLTDVAYGMDDCYSLPDIAPLREYIDIALTSVAVGFRKPDQRGFRALLEALNVSAAEALYVGDEEKDMRGAKSAGMGAVLLDRQGRRPDWGQDAAITALTELKQWIHL